MKTLVFMPAYNEAGNIREVIQEVKLLHPNIDFLVIDDGSTDLTAEIARQNGAYVISFPYNLGIGSAVETGYKFATTENYQRVIRMDADGQHDPKFINEILKNLDDYDVVLTSRFLDSDYRYQIEPPRKFMIKILSSVISLNSPIKITDATNSFRGTNQRATQFLAENSSAEFMTDAIDSLARLLRAGYKPTELDAPLRQRNSGKASQNYLKLIYHTFRSFISLLLILTEKKGVVS
jgi:glycosyltransferase involved in cell wall biosynthesis